MESEYEPDKLHIQENHKYEALLNTSSEPVMYSNKCYKFDAYGSKIEKDIVLTTNYIYILENLKGSRNIKAKILIQDVKAIIKASSKDNFIMHIPTRFDFRFELSNKDEFVRILQLRFANLNPVETLKIYEVSDNLEKYVTTVKDKKYGISNLPSNSMRCKSEELAGTEELKEESETIDNIDTNDDETDSKGTYTVTEDFKMQNSRENGVKVENISNEESKANQTFEKDELTVRESVLIYSSRKLKLGKPKELTLESFKIITVLGKGTFGKVYLTELIDDKSLYAIKAIRKDVLIETEQVESTKQERDILLECDHPFLCGMDYVFQNDLRLYFVMPFIRGGELYKHFLKCKRFPESQVKFYAIQIVLALGYLHSKDICHRDMKLENILIDETGYLKLIDFGLAKILKDSELSQSFCGTPEYLAPEMVAQKGHDKTVDWWAVGILIYEMLIGVTPFYNRSRNLMLVKIQQSKIVFPDKSKYKIEYSEEVQDVICKLLNKKKSKRLGAIDDYEEVLSHPWFSEFDIDDIIAKKVKAPFIPEFDDQYDTKYFNFKADFNSTLIPEEKVKEIKSYSDKFAGFEKNLNKIKKG